MDTDTLIQTETLIKVPFHDVDSMGVAWHGHYAKYLEVARCEFLDEVGYNYDAMEQSGYMWPIIDMQIKYVKPLRFDQVVRVVTQLAEWEYRLKLKYVIYDQTTGERLCKAHTSQVAVDGKTGEMCFQSPQILIERLGKH
ncbi:acyl-CoA thioesterase [Teredinibacter turnerae]|uniref:acyl-CoA thioesterase n=1 Tax=Teredinibacter turnerae TaxID=2426 RepID=UPI00037B6B71|nr:acyl-CoA thioesterase [Teredinibacter turnerae]